MDYCIIDYETRSLVNLPEADTVNYAKDKSTGIISVSFAFLSEYEKTGKIYSFTPFIPGDMEKAAKILSKFKGLIVAHNYFFEMMISRHVWNSPLLEHFTKAENYVCTQALAYRFGLPGKLEDVARALELKQQKDAQAGKNLIMKFSVPKKGILLEPTEQDIKDFIKYGEQDVRTEIELFKNLKGFDEFELKSFRLDQKINERGLRLDVKAVKILQDKYTEIFNRAMIRAEKIAGFTPSGSLIIKSSSGFLNWLNEKGIAVENVQKPTLEKIESKLGKTKKDKLIKESFLLRNLLNAKAPTKLHSMLTKLNGEFVYKILQYYGAHTGRFAGRSFQPHNLIRDAISEKDFPEILKDIRDGKFSDYEIVELIGKMLRALIIPHKGNVFIGGDFNAIEARVAFWLSGCVEGMKWFSEYDDGITDIDPYMRFSHYIKPIESFSHKIKRGIGKIGILQLQYGSGASKVSSKLEETTGKEDLKIAKYIVNFYRNKFREIPQMWQLLESSFVKALHTKKEIVIHNGLLRIKPIRSGLKVTLPSGRALYYRKAGVSNGKFFYTHPRYGKIYVWGGVLFENIVQAISRDLMIEAMLKLDSHKYFDIALTVHDEILGECPVKQSKQTLQYFEKVMNSSPEWATGLPVKASSGIMKRYGKT